MSVQLRVLETGLSDIFYRTGSSQKTPGLMFVHGAGGDSRFFMKQLRYFGSLRKTIAIDLPGHGRSTRTGLPVVRNYIDAIVDVARAESAFPLVLAGHSMGGMICLCFYEKFAGLVDSMVLVSAFSRLDVPQGIYEWLERDPAGFVEMMTGSVFSSRIASIARGLRGPGSSIDPEVLRRDIEICGKTDCSASLSGINVPVLVIGNRFDRIVSSGHTEYLADSIKTSGLVLFDHESHVPFFEQSMEFNGLVESFIA